MINGTRLACLVVTVRQIQAGIGRCSDAVRTGWPARSRIRIRSRIRSSSWVNCTLQNATSLLTLVFSNNTCIIQITLALHSSSSKGRRTDLFGYFRRYGPSKYLESSVLYDLYPMKWNLKHLFRQSQTLRFVVIIGMALVAKQISNVYKSRIHAIKFKKQQFRSSLISFFGSLKP